MPASLKAIHETRCRPIPDGGIAGTATSGDPSPAVPSRPHSQGQRAVPGPLPIDSPREERPGTITPKQALARARAHQARLDAAARQYVRFLCARNG